MIVVGVDIGGTSARAALYEDDSERGRNQGVGRSMRSGDGDAVAQLIAELVRPLLLRSRSVRADALVVGAAGAGREAERGELERALESLRLAWRLIVTTDAELARSAAFQGKPGVLLIAGTGSIAVALDARGETRRFGGLGWRMGDQGSAYWLGTRALQAVGAMRDGTGTVTHLAESLCTAAGVAGIAGLVHWSTTAAPAQVAALAPAVLVLADRGDPVATAIRGDAVEELTALAVAAGGASLDVALSGGLIAPGGPLRRLLLESLVRHGVGVHDSSVDPCRGAVWLAR